MNEVYSEIIDRLSQDPVRNIALLGFFENYPLQRVYQSGASYLLLGKSDHLWGYISSENEAELAGVLDPVEKAGDIIKHFACVEEWMKPILTRGGGDEKIDWELKTMRFVLPETQEIKEPSRMVLPLDASWVDYIFSHSDYQEFTSKEYIQEQIKKGMSAGIVENDKLIAWALTHDDSSVGFLHVLPEFRKHGYGKAITRAMILQKRKAHKPVFVNVEPGNSNSLKLVAKLGFVPDRQVGWLKLK